MSAHAPAAFKGADAAAAADKFAVLVGEAGKEAPELAEVAEVLEIGDVSGKGRGDMLGDASADDTAGEGTGDVSAAGDAPGEVSDSAVGVGDSCKLRPETSEA